VRPSTQHVIDADSEAAAVITSTVMVVVVGL
jgi:hypothetical protein